MSAFDRNRLAIPLLVLVTVTTWPCPQPARAAPTTVSNSPVLGVCSDLSVGVPVDSFDTSRSPFLGRALGQTFVAPETVITSFTAWRPANNLSVVGAHLFITAVDTTLTPARPIAHQILLDGPTVTVYDSSPPGQVIEMSFVIDPPLVLPRAGTYAWFLQAENCNQGAVWEILGDDRDEYPGGIYWLSGRATMTCHLANVDGGEDFTDLCFRMEFCNSFTPTRRQSWGALKVLYR